MLGQLEEEKWLRIHAKLLVSVGNIANIVKSETIQFVVIQNFLLICIDLDISSLSM